MEKIKTGNEEKENRSRGIIIIQRRIHPPFQPIILKLKFLHARLRLLTIRRKNIKLYYI